MHTPLTTEQEELLRVLVEASRSQAKDARQEFMPVRTNRDEIVHPHVPGGEFPTYRGDVDALAANGFIRTRSGSRGMAILLDVTPAGFAHYEELARRDGEGAVRLETTIRRFLDSERFRARHAASSAKWREAEEALWGAGSETAATKIGHDCREAMQLFATEMLELAGNPEAVADPTKTVDRVRAALRSRVESDKVGAYLDALVHYWGTTADLAQRQEHGSQKGGEALSWEDAQRLVFGSV
jgi:hypothetical protein